MQGAAEEGGVGRKMAMDGPGPPAAGGPCGGSRKGKRSLCRIPVDCGLFQKFRLSFRNPGPVREADSVSGFGPATTHHHGGGKCGKAPEEQGGLRNDNVLVEGLRVGSGFVGRENDILKSNAVVAGCAGEGPEIEFGGLIGLGNSGIGEVGEPALCEVHGILSKDRLVAGALAADMTYARRIG